jgi:4-hydroxy-tetrahydrodipicolinate synthase
MVWVALPRVSAGSAGVGSFKTAMKGLGIIETNVMARPQRTLDDAESAKIMEIVRTAGLTG